MEIILAYSQPTVWVSTDFYPLFLAGVLLTSGGVIDTLIVVSAQFEKGLLGGGNFANTPPTQISIFRKSNTAHKYFLLIKYLS